MAKPATTTDPMIMSVRKALQSSEPRPLPTKTKSHEVVIHGNVVAVHHGWECPICHEYVRRDDKIRYRRHGREEIIDYSGYNIHFAHNHATPFWKEQRVIRAVKLYLEKEKS